MSKTTNLGLELTGTSSEDTSQSFLTWRQKINGESSDSNMNKIDAAVGDLKSAITYNTNFEELTYTAYQGTFGNVAQGNSFSNMNVIASTTRIRSFDTIDDAKNITLPANIPFRISCDTGYQYAVQAYGKNDLVALDVYEWKTASTTIQKGEDCWLVIAFAKTTANTNILPSEITHLKIEICANEIKDKIIEIGSEITPLETVKDDFNSIFAKEPQYEPVDLPEYLLDGNLFLKYDKTIVETNLSLKCAKIPVTEGQIYHITGSSKGDVALYGLANSSDVIQSVVPNSYSSTTTLPTFDDIVTIPSGIAYLYVNRNNAWNIPLTSCDVQDGEIVRRTQPLEADELSASLFNQNILYGKKLGTAGTSITAGEYAETDATTGYKKTYGGYTAIRNGMTFYNYGISGSTLQNIIGKNPFCVDRYQNMASDLDYLTIEFGWNDNAYGTLGEMTDEVDTTFCGAWNIVLPWLIEHYPNTKIGLIVPYGTTPEMRQAVRDMAVKYGLPYFDTTGNPQHPYIFGREPALAIDDYIKTVWRNRFLYDGIHPNDAGYKAWSTAFEAWLRSI